jgi:hypothetical protein
MDLSVLHWINRSHEEIETHRKVIIALVIGKSSTRKESLKANFPVLGWEYTLGSSSLHKDKRLHLNMHAD